MHEVLNGLFHWTGLIFWLLIVAGLILGTAFSLIEEVRTVRLERKQEKEKLDKYVESVRNSYLNAGSGKPLIDKEVDILDRREEIGTLARIEIELDGIMEKLKREGKMTLTMSCRFSNVLDELRYIRKTFESEDIDGTGVGSEDAESDESSAIETEA